MAFTKTLEKVVELLYNKSMTNKERQKKYYYAHREEKRLAREILGISTYTATHRRYYEKKAREKKACDCVGGGG